MLDSLMVRYLMSQSDAGSEQLQGSPDISLWWLLSSSLIRASALYHGIRLHHPAAAAVASTRSLRPTRPETHGINYEAALWQHIKNRWWNVPVPADSVTAVIYSFFLICKLCLIKAVLWAEWWQRSSPKNFSKWDFNWENTMSVLIETLRRNRPCEIWGRDSNFTKENTGSRSDVDLVSDLQGWFHRGS